jgi:hypothetical protein
MNHKTTGEISEANIIAALITKDWTVSTTFCDNKRYDLVAESPNAPGKLLRVQCKTGRLKNGVIDFQCVSQARNYKRDYHGQIDLFAVFCPETFRVYLVPIESCGVTHVLLRVDYPKNGQITGIQWASERILGDVPADHFMPSRDAPPILDFSRTQTPNVHAARERNRKIHLSPEELQCKVWEKPLQQVAKDLGVSDVALKKACTRVGVETPKQGYWLSSK